MDGKHNDSLIMKLLAAVVLVMMALFIINIILAILRMSIGLFIEAVIIVAIGYVVWFVYKKLKNQ